MMNFVDLRSGTSVEGDEIKAHRSEKKSEKYTYLLAGTHGDEVEGVYVLQNLFDWLLKHDEINIPMVVIPILNVDGHRSGTRTNSHGVDLNRNYDTTNWSADFKVPKYNPGSGPLSEPENKFLAKLFDKLPPKMIISFHSWKPLLNTNGDCKEIAEFIKRYNSYPVEETVGYPTPGSLGNFGPEKYNSPVLTYECPPISEEKTLKSIWEENRAGLESLMTSNLLN